MSLRKEGFWDDHYSNELKNFEDCGDEGEVWFGKGLTRKISSWLIKHLEAKSQQEQTVKIIDIGCGNAFFLCDLINKYQSSYGDGSKLKLETLGIDYSANSIELSKKLIIEKGLTQDIQVVQCDFLNLASVISASQGFKYDYIVDIGTYDAICLLASQSASATEDARSQYIKSLISLIKKTSIFILASCNNTESELSEVFDVFEGKVFRLLDRIKTPEITFGGKQGNQVTCLIFQIEDSISSST